MLERDIEGYARDRCKEIGAMFEKFTSPARRFVPDRIITYHGVIIFVEFKVPGKKPSEAQARDHKRREDNGATVLVIDSCEQVDKLIKRLQSDWYRYE